MSTKLSLSDFQFTPIGYGHYRVTYTSPLSGTRWARTTNDMPLIDRVKNADTPTQSDLNRLKRTCKLGVIIQ